MGHSKTLSDALLMEGAKKVKQAFGRIGTKMPKDLDEKALDSQIGKYDGSLGEVKRVNAQRRQAVNEKNVNRKAIKRFIKRVRATVAGVFGDDSIELALVGGKPMSERKRPGRRRSVVAPVKAA